MFNGRPLNLIEPSAKPTGVDLHIHTTASDGTDAPAAVVRMCKERNVGIIAITDHDTVDGIEEAYRTGKTCGLRVIPGIEISAGFKKHSIHILGIGIGDPDTAFHDMLRNIRNGRQDRNPRIIAKLRQLGFSLTEEDVRRCAGGDILGRLHIARAMVNRGYVQTIEQAFKRYLVRGGSAYVERFRPDAREAIESIVRIGGLPVLAHPGLLPFDQNLRRLESWIVDLKALGIEAIETHYFGHSHEICSVLTAIAARHHLLVSGGSDYHGSHKPNQLGLGCCGRKITRDFAGPILERLNVPVSAGQN